MIHLPKEDVMTTAHSKATDDELQIHSVLDDRIDALRTRDAKRFMSHFADEFVTFELSPPLQYRFTAADRRNLTGLEEWFASFKGPVEYEMRDLKTTTGKGVAFCHSLYRIAGTKTDGDEIDIWTRQTLCFRKINDEWKITHSHMSAPFYMDGIGKAALDLKPQ
jgi:ketosteroid isomerase-like protein